MNKLLKIHDFLNKHEYTCIQIDAVENATGRRTYYRTCKICGKKQLGIDSFLDNGDLYIYWE